MPVWSVESGGHGDPGRSENQGFDPSGRQFHTGGQNLKHGIFIGTISRFLVT